MNNNSKMILRTNLKDQEIIKQEAKGSHHVMDKDGEIWMCEVNIGYCMLLAREDEREKMRQKCKDEAKDVPCIRRVSNQPRIKQFHKSRVR